MNQVQVRHKRISQTDQGPIQPDRKHLLTVRGLRARVIASGIILLALIALLATSTMAQSPDFHIYLAFGQSNMEGGPSVSGIQTPARFQTMQAVDCSRLNPPRTKGTWYTANPPISRCNQGPGIAYWFGRNMVDSTPANIKIGMINVAVAGCKIELFDKATYKAYADTVESWMTAYINEYGGSPYHRMVEVAKLAQKEGVIKGILLHQGESNNGDQQWPNKVKKIYDDLIAELNLDPKQVPLLAGELVNADVNGATAGHNTVIARLPSVLPNSHVISSKALGNPTGDRLHFTADGYKEFGRRYAATMLTVQKQNATGIRAPNRAAGYVLGRESLNLRNGKAAITFEIPRPGFVSLKVFDLKGKAIAELTAAEYAAGRHVIEFDRKFLQTESSRGFSLFRMQAEGFTTTQKFFLGAE
jgi:Carbohydrate esterase, sialic acid-specific acetylesterase